MAKTSSVNNCYKGAIRPHNRLFFFQRARALPLFLQTKPTMKIQITDIEFDLTDAEDCGEDAEMLQTKLHLGYTKTSWDADDYEDLVEQISYKCGWDIISIQYEVIK